MKKFSPPQMKEVSFPTPHTPHPTASFQSEVRQTLSSHHSILAPLGLPAVVVEIPHFLSFK